MRACLAAGDNCCDVNQNVARQAALHRPLGRRRLAACSTASLERRRRAWWRQAARPAGGTRRAHSGTPGTHRLRGTEKRRLQQAGRTAGGVPIRCRRHAWQAVLGGARA